MPAVVNAMKEEATLVTLVKPQFEARRSQVRNIFIHVEWTYIHHMPIKCMFFILHYGCNVVKNWRSTKKIVIVVCEGSVRLTVNCTSNLFEPLCRLEVVGLWEIPKCIRRYAKITSSRYRLFWTSDMIG